jgi:hypothetical protein
MPRPVPRIGPAGVALTAWEVWRRLPPSQRKRILKQVRKHGPAVAAMAVRYASKRRAARGSDKTV